MRLVPCSEILMGESCEICRAEGTTWDQISGRTMCLDCQEALARGDAGVWRLRPEQGACALCNFQQTVRYLSFPLFEPDPIEIDLCGRHLRKLLARNLSERAFRKLRRRLNQLGFAIEQLFLLHEAFYDEDGRSLAPLNGE